MDRIRIVGGNRLKGRIPISGAKNAALPLMIASLLTRERLTLKNVPDLADVNLLVKILGNHGVDYEQQRPISNRPGIQRQLRGHRPQSGLVPWPGCGVPRPAKVHRMALVHG